MELSKEVIAKLDNAKAGKNDGDFISAMLITVMEILDEQNVISADDFCDKLSNNLKG